MTYWYGRPGVEYQGRTWYGYQEVVITGVGLNGMEVDGDDQTIKLPAFSHLTLNVAPVHLDGLGTLTLVRFLPSGLWEAWVDPPEDAKDRTKIALLAVLRLT
jgi:hypothetical protein